MPYLISVLISVYNSRRFIDKKINEILAQTLFEKSEYIFIETGSPEKERELLSPFCEQHANCRLITTDERKTLYEAWNIGWLAATTPVICYSNMDDCMHPRLLENVVQKMEKKCWDACTTLIVKQNLSAIQAGDWSLENMKGLSFSLRPGPFTAWRSCLKERIGLFDTKLVVAGDKDFWARMLAARLRIGLIPKALYLYAKDPQNQLSKSTEGRRIRKEEEALLALRDYPVKWSYLLRWKIFFLRYIWRLFPKPFLE